MLDLPLDDALEICPSVELLSEATGSSFTDVAAFEDQLDFLGLDLESGVTRCSYMSTESALIIGIHNSTINKALFLDSPPAGAIVDELPSGAIQLQFEGQTSCEIYDDQLSFILSSESDSADTCAMVNSAAEAVQ